MCFYTRKHRLAEVEHGSDENALRKMESKMTLIYFPQNDKLSMSRNEECILKV